jgi:hypothetical protein
MKPQRKARISWPAQLSTAKTITGPPTDVRIATVIRSALLEHLVQAIEESEEQAPLSVTRRLRDLHRSFAQHRTTALWWIVNRDKIEVLKRTQRFWQPWETP